MRKLKGKYLLSGTLLIVLLLWSLSFFSPRKNPANGLLYHNLSIVIGNRTEYTTVPAPNGSTVFEVLNKTYPVEYRRYGDMGVFITSINNLSQNSTHSWLYLVNGKVANKAADKYRLFSNSTIEWVFMNNEEAMKFFSE